MRNQILICALLACLVALFSWGQEPPKPMTNQDVTEMVSLGLSDDVIVDKIHAAVATDFDTGVEALKALKAAKVSDAVLRAMISPHPAAGVPGPGQTMVASFWVLVIILAWYKFPPPGERSRTSLSPTNRVEK